MKKFLGSVLIFCLMAGSSLAQSAKPASQAATPAKTPAAAMATTAVDELIGLLPAADLIAVVDVNRLFNELLPRLAEFDIAGVGKLAKEVAEFTRKTGIDPTKVGNAVIGLSLKDSEPTGAIIVSGLDLSRAQIEALMKEFKSEFKTSDYKGKTIFNIISKDEKDKKPEAAPVPVKMDETALAALGNQRFVFGDLAAVKQVIDISSGAAKSNLTPAVVDALRETRASALLRLALNVPEELKKSAADQGDLFKSVSAIKMILGTFDVANDFSMSLDAVARTTSPKDATELEEGLKGLVSIFKGLFGGNNDPKMEVIDQLFDQIKLGSKASDVTLSITLPRALLDQLAKKPAPDEAKKPAPDEAKKPAPDEAKKPAPDEAKKPAPDEAKKPAPAVKKP